MQRRDGPVAGGAGWCPGQGYWVVILVKALISQIASSNPDILVCTGKLNPGGNLAMDYHAIRQEGVEIFPVVSSYLKSR